MKITPGQIKKLHLFLNKVKTLPKEEREAFKRDLIKHYSSNRTESVKELNFYEANQVINHIKAIVEEDKPDDPADVMRKKIISMLREVGYEKFDTIKNRKVADMQRIYKLIKEKGYLKPKYLNEYTHDELPKLVSQIENIYITTLKKK